MESLIIFETEWREKSMCNTMVDHANGYFSLGLILKVWYGMCIISAFEFTKS